MGLSGKQKEAVNVDGHGEQYSVPGLYFLFLFKIIAHWTGVRSLGVFFYALGSCCRSRGQPHNARGLVFYFSAVLLLLRSVERICLVAHLPYRTYHPWLESYIIHGWNHTSCMVRIMQHAWLKAYYIFYYWNTTHKHPKFTMAHLVHQSV